MRLFCFAIKAAWIPELNGTYLLNIVWLTLLPLQKGFEDQQPMLNTGLVPQEGSIRTAEWKTTIQTLVEMKQNTASKNNWYLLKNVDL